MYQSGLNTTITYIYEKQHVNKMIENNNRFLTVLILKIELTIEIKLNISKYNDNLPNMLKFRVKIDNNIEIKATFIKNSDSLSFVCLKLTKR